MIVEQITDEEIPEVPQWQIDEGRKIREYYEKHPDELLSWEEVRKQLEFK